MGLWLRLPEHGKNSWSWREDGTITTTGTVRIRHRRQSTDFQARNQPFATAHYGHTRRLNKVAN